MIAVLSKAGFVISCAMVAAGMSALAIRVVIPEVSGTTVVLFQRTTYVLFITYLLITFDLFWLFIWIVLGTGSELRQIRNAGRDLLIVLGIVLLLQGTLGVLDAMGIVYMRAVVLIPAVFLMLIGLVWAAIVGSKKEEQAASALKPEHR
jgi:hypothetical protein